MRIKKKTSDGYMAYPEDFYRNYESATNRDVAGIPMIPKEGSRADNPTPPIPFDVVHTKQQMNVIDNSSYPGDRTSKSRFKPPSKKPKPRLV